MYSLWCFAHYSFIKSENNYQHIKEKLIKFYTEYKKPKQEIKDKNVKAYKDAMVSNTKASSQRKKRMEALISYVYN